MCQFDLSYRLRVMEYDGSSRPGEEKEAAANRPCVYSWFFSLEMPNYIRYAVKSFICPAEVPSAAPRFQGQGCHNVTRTKVSKCLVPSAPSIQRSKPKA